MYYYFYCVNLKKSITQIIMRTVNQRAGVLSRMRI